MEEAIRLLGIARAEDTITACQAFKAFWQLRLTDAKRWAAVAFYLGFVTVLALTIAIVFVAIGKNGTAISSGVGTILSGAATTWVWTRRSAVQKEAEEFLAKVKEYCAE